MTLRVSFLLLVVALLVSSTSVTPIWDEGRVRQRCKPLQDPNGYWEGSTNIGGIYTLTCVYGYGVHGNQSVSLTCSPDGQWPGNPWCQNLDDCDQLKHGCGPAGLCVDHVGYAECLCQSGSSMHSKDDEDVCFFGGAGRWEKCGVMNCGPHGVCVDLLDYQSGFEEGLPYRCSCEHGYHDDSHDDELICKPLDCGPLDDKYGIWIGSSVYLGEYTLHCSEGAYVWGGSEKAITISCPQSGTWRLQPICLSPTEEEQERRDRWIRFLGNIVMTAACLGCAAMAAGLIMGLVSLEPRELQIIKNTRLEDCATDSETESLQRAKLAAKRVLPVLKDQHLALVTLLVVQSVAGESFPLFLEPIAGPFAVPLATVLMATCGELLPQSIVLGPSQLAIASASVPLVRVLMLLLFFVAKPIAYILDCLVAHGDDRLSREAIRSVLKLHARRTAEDQISKINSADLESASLIQCAERTEDETSPLVGEKYVYDDDHLEQMEVDLCLGVLDLGLLLVSQSNGFRPLESCGSDFHLVAARTAPQAAGAEAITKGFRAVVVVSSTADFSWQVAASSHMVIGVFGATELLSTASESLEQLCSGIPRVKATDRITTALYALNLTIQSHGFAIVCHNNENCVGILEGAKAASPLLTWLEHE